MRAIDADAFYKDICNSVEEALKLWIPVDGEYLWAKLNDALDNAPTVDIVYCWECAFRGRIGCPRRNKTTNRDNDFCSHGKREDKL